MPFRSLYVHIPFCERKCPYCDFHSVELGGDDVAAYLDAVVRDLRERDVHGAPLETVFVGGGTPTTVPANGIARILDAAFERFGRAEDCEVTVEANPGSADAAKFRQLRSSGVNRISIGVQSWDDAELAQLGRIHSAGDAERAFGAAREAGFENVNLDLIHSLPGQSVATWRGHLEQTVRLAPEHVSAYQLTYEPETAFGAALRRGTIRPADDETQRAMLEATGEQLGSAGYRRYETSNYARPGLDCQHNRTYWSRSPYLGIGAGAHSFLVEGGVERRSWNVRGATAYARSVAEGRPVAGEETVSTLQAAQETVLLSLRTEEGFDLAAYAARFGTAAADEIRHRAAERLAWVELSGDRLCLTAAGRLVADGVILELAPETAPEPVARVA